MAIAVSYKTERTSFPDVILFYLNLPLSSFRFMYVFFSFQGFTHEKRFGIKQVWRIITKIYVKPLGFSKIGNLRKEIL